MSDGLSITASGLIEAQARASTAALNIVAAASELSSLEPTLEIPSATPGVDGSGSAPTSSAPPGAVPAPAPPSISGSVLAATLIKDLVDLGVSEAGFGASAQAFTILSEIEDTAIGLTVDTDS